MRMLDFLATVPGFDALSTEDLERTVEMVHEESFTDGEYLMRRGEMGASMHVILDGSVQVPVFDATGRVRLVAKLGEGDVVGEMALLTGERRRADVIAEGDVKTIVFEREVLAPLLAEQPPLARFLTEILGQRLEQAGGIEQVGKYRLLGKIGEGATAKVYEAIHPGLDRTVAVKMLGHHLVYDKTFKDRFLEEARTIAALSHPNIVQVFDTEQAYATWFLVMERLEGKDLQEVLDERGPLEAGETRSILAQLATALAYAHGHGIVHRDVKPSNAQVSDDGEVKLMDFGIAQRIRSGGERSSFVEGTPRYLAPEAALGHAPDHRADIYSLGVVAFEMVTGRPLFRASSIEELVESHAFKPPPDIGRLRPDLPAGLTAFIRGALAKKPEHRLGDWPTILEMLEPAAGQTGSPAGMEEQIVRIRYRPQQRGRVDKAVATLEKSLSALRDGDVATAMLVDSSGPGAETPQTRTGWFAKLTSRKAALDPNASQTRSMDRTIDD
jgi:eukaryotic-like serine/threonine-protein kinase